MPCDPAHFGHATWPVAHARYRTFRGIHASVAGVLHCPRRPRGPSNHVGNVAHRSGGRSDPLSLGYPNVLTGKRVRVSHEASPR